MRKLLALLLIFSFSFGTALANGSLFEMNISSNEATFEFEGDFAGGQMGAVLTAGDFNNDGFEDIAMGAPFTSLPEKKWAGAVKVVFGDSTGKNFKKMSFLGVNAGDQFGTALLTGDFNHDGIDDLAMGAFGALLRESKAGAVYIMYGSKNWGSQTRDLALNKPDLTLTGMKGGDGFGLALMKADINKDEIDDLLVGAPFASTGDKDRSGAVYAFRGGVTGLSYNHDNIFYGQSNEERFGASMATGDFNGDKKEDIVIGGYFADLDKFESAGKLYIYDGERFFSQIVEKADKEIKGSMNYGWLGFSLNVADVNSDLKDDIIASNFPFSGKREESKVLAYYGWDKFFENKTFVSKKRLTESIEGDLEENILGSYIVVADFDGDEKDDVVVGAPGIGNPVSIEPGEVYIFYGNGKITKIKGDAADDWFGYSASALDFNGDGKKDLAIGSRYAEGDGAVNSGKTFVLLGDGGIWGTEKDLSLEYVNRGEFIKEIFEKFDLKKKKADYIQKCYEYKEFCLFNFLAVTLNDNVELDPEVLLYPDIGKEHELYESVTLATMLGLINGYLNEEGSPFHPERAISRIQALKVILAACDLVKPKYKFELVKMFGSVEKFNQQKTYFSDINLRNSYMWWYPMYANFAVENGLIDQETLFRPDDNITMAELNELINRTIKLIDKNEEIDARGDL